MTRQRNSKHEDGRQKPRNWRRKKRLARDQACAARRRNRGQ